MALVLADRVRETSTTTGTGSVTLAGAYTGFQTFSAGVGNSNSTYYTIANVVSGEYEVGIGTYTSGGNTLSRTTVLTSSNANALVNFGSGSKDVFVTQPARRAVYVEGTSVVAANSATVPNSLLANSSLTLGSTALTLGATTTSVAGLTLTTAAVNGTLGATTPSTVAATSVTASAGTAALPAITTTGNTNTGIFFPAADTIGFSKGGAEAMRIDSSGNLLVGTSSPAGKLDITSGTARMLFSNQSATAFFTAVNTANSAYAPMAINGSQMILKTEDAERMRIDTTGNLLVGTSTVIGGSSAFLHVINIDGAKNGIAVGNSTGSAATVAMRLLNSNGTVGSIITSGLTTAYNTSSDYRLKYNIAPMTGALAKVAALKPVTHKWKADGSEGEGFIAHELAEVCPHAVTGEKDAVDADGKPQYQGIDTSFLVATLTAAIQELKTLVDNQASTIQSLTTRITALEAK